MTPEQALDLLDRASSAFSGPRKDHELIQQAVSCLKAVIEIAKNHSSSEGSPSKAVAE